MGSAYVEFVGIWRRIGSQYKELTGIGYDANFSPS